MSKRPKISDLMRTDPHSWGDGVDTPDRHFFSEIVNSALEDLVPPTNFLRGFATGTPRQRRKKMIAYRYKLNEWCDLRFNALAYLFDDDTDPPSVRYIVSALGYPESGVDALRRYARSTKAEFDAAFETLIERGRLQFGVDVLNVELKGGILSEAA